MAEAWWCTYCGEQHNPDPYTKLDARFATGACDRGVHQVLIRNRDEALQLAYSEKGKHKPKKDDHG